jgi:hypothetical protein
MTMVMASISSKVDVCAAIWGTLATTVTMIHGHIQIPGLLPKIWQM